MTPGDAFVDPLIRRGEELERLMLRSDRPASDAEASELASLKVYAAGRIRHLAQFPLASTSQEESAQYLAQQEARSAHEREQAALAALRKFLALLEPVALAALQGALTRGVASLPVPVELRGVVTAVEAAAMDAARTAAADLTPR